MSAAVKTWDTETTTDTAFKRKANPFLPSNWVVTHGYKPKDGEPVEFRFGKQRPPSGWLRPVLEGTKLLIGQNIKFDLLHALQDAENLELWMDYVANGGRIWDIQLAEYLLNGMGQKDHMLSLDELAPRYGGTIKVDEVKALWDAGVRTEDIEPALLSRYLIGGEDEHGEWGHGDLGNTELVALAQIERARREGSLNKIMLDMGSLIASTEMERNGMFVDKAQALEQAAELREEIARLKAELESFVPADLPFEFKWTSRHHKSALIFGGSVPYEGPEYMAKDGTWGPLPWDSSLVDGEAHGGQAYAQMDVVCVRPVVPVDSPVLAHDRGDGWVPLEIAKLADVPVVRYAGGKNAGEVKTKKLKQDGPSKPKKRQTRYLYRFQGFTEGAKKWETSEPGVYKTGADVIEELGVRDIPFLKTLAEYAKLSKDLSTYYITEDEDGKQKGMLTLVGPDGIIHHSINHTSTVTTRFSSSDPNLQNVSGSEKSQVKSNFKSRFGGKVIQSDFTSLEVYVQAILSLARQLIADLLAGLDMHINRVSATLGISYEEAMKRYEDPATNAEYKKRRKGAKVFSFQRAYGAGVAKIAATTGMSIEDVEALVAAELAQYPEINAFNLSVEAAVKASRKPTSNYVPHPDFPGVICQIGRGFWRSPTGQLFMFQESPSPEYLVKRGITQSFSPTEMKNYPVQGEGSTWMKAAMYLAVRAFYARRNFNGKALLVNTVHDALYGDAHKDVAREAAVLIHAAMEAATEFIEYTFNWTMPLAVPSETTWGESMIDEDEIPGIKADAQAVRRELRRLYMNDYQPSFEKGALNGLQSTGS